MQTRNIKLAIVRIPFIGRAILAIHKIHTALRYFRKPFFNFVKCLFTSNEVTNFTYDLKETNKRYLASLIADVVGTDTESIMTYMRELEEDEPLRQHLEQATAESDLAFMSDRKVHFGRRLGWYALARALKPRVVIETGVDKGLGACVLCAALKRNEEKRPWRQILRHRYQSSSGVLVLWRIR